MSTPQTSLIPKPFVPDAFKLLDRVPIGVHVELARKIMTLGDLLELREGDVVTLPRAAGDNINVYVGGALIGAGEVLLLEGALAIRIAELREASPLHEDEHEPERRTA
jgi:flagellar motor switch protein FliN/FliY